MTSRYLIVGILVALVLAAGALYQFIGSRRGARRHVPPGMMVDVGGQRLHVVCAGNGKPTVLFESGIAASSLSWTRVLRDVATFTRACAYDRAGLGWSDPSRGPRTLARMLGELRGVLANAATAGPYVFVGHSFGAFLVCAYASQHPSEVAGLVLLDPPSEWHEITREQARLLWGGIQLSRIGGILARLGIVRACLALLTGGAPGVPRNFVRIFGPTAARTLERLVGEVRKLPARRSSDGAGALVPAEMFSGDGRSPLRTGGNGRHGRRRDVASRRSAGHRLERRSTGGHDREASRARAAVIAGSITDRREERPLDPVRRAGSRGHDHP